MAGEQKRLPVKHIRDKAKAAYKKDSHCAICGTTEALDFHHYYTMTPLLMKWVKEHKIDISTDEAVIAMRDDYIAAHRYEIYEATVTLCHPHHMKLHSIYGKDPTLATAKKQMNWVEIQRNKHNGNN